MDRKKIIGLIHIAKDDARECPVCGKVSFKGKCNICGIKTRKLPEKRYREMLESFGASSCRFLDDSGLKKVYETFIRAGFKPRVNPEEYHQRAMKKTRAVIIARARELFGDGLWEKRVNGFIQKGLGKQNLGACNDIELRKIAGWLYRYKQYMEKRLQEKQIEENE